MATKDRSVIADDSNSGPTKVWSDGVSQNTYLFVYILAMVLSSWIFIRYW
ncbi:MAG TPA: hypothetical protein HA345_01360 [Candidatus Thalassarchaeaceae archaeon]|nr:hypothetical protein [Candidatus Thalassarchaeaceae archaeon]